MLMAISNHEPLGSLGNFGEMEAKSIRQANLYHRGQLAVRLGASMSPGPSSFAPLLFAGRLPDGFAALVKAGFTAVEISLRSVDDLDVLWMDERLSECGLVVSAFATGRMCLEDSLCLSHTNSIVRRQLYERLAGLIQLAAHFNASVIIGGVRGKLSGDEHQQADQRNIALDSLRQCAAVASEAGVNLLLEPINRYETNFINSAQQGIELIDAVGNPCVKLLLDTFHMNIEEIDPCSTIRAASKYLGYIHFADSNRQAPGRGHINFPAIVDTLADVGYQGFIIAEILPVPDDTQALFSAGNYLQSLFFDKTKEKLQ